MHSQSKAWQVAIMGMLSAIILIFAFTPLGFIRLPFINATILHIPVIIGSILLGAKYGAALGFLFGITSLINNTIAPNPFISFVFSPFIPVPTTGAGNPFALVVCFLPRILVGIFPYYTFKAMQKLLKDRAELLSLTVSGIIGSMTNTLLVMHLIFFLFGDSFAYARALPAEAVYAAVLAIIAANGVPEAIVAAILTSAVCVPIMVIQKRSLKAR